MLKERNYRISGNLPCSIALVSDLHNADGSEALRCMAERRPDLIAITGDLFLGYHMLEGADLLCIQLNILPFLEGCVRLAPTYLSLGNHEWVASASDFRKVHSTGAIILDNRWVRDETSGLVIGGLTSGMMTDYRLFRKKHRDGTPYPSKVRHTSAFLLPPDTRWLDDFEQQDGYKVLLCHHPEYWCLREPMLIDRRIDLILSGHAHGGQIRLFGRGLYAPGQGLLPGYTGGLHTGPHGQLLISHGLSNTAPPPIPRLFNPREIVFARPASSRRS